MRISDEAVKEHYLYQELQERFDELCSYAEDLSDRCNDMSTDLKYLSDYVRYKNLEEEYRYFRDHAHLDETDGLPFPSYVL